LALEAGRAELAVELLSRAASLEPANARALHELGKALSVAKRDLEAIAIFQSALQANEDDAELQNDLGTALARTDRLEEAKVAFRKAIELKPDHVEARCNLGAALNEQHCFDAAIDAYREAIRIRPDFAEAHRSMGYALAHIGKLDEAISSYRRAVELNPADAATDGYARFLLYYHPAWDAAGILREQRIWNERYAKPLASLVRPQHRGHSVESLRIGYVSPHFHYHVVGHHMLALFQKHDRTRFEIFAYSNVEKPDALTMELSKSCDYWRNIREKNDAETVELIRADGIDILIDLALHTDGNRLLVFARKPAPVQAAYLGYCGTTGMDAMDYRLSDPYLDPPDADLTCYSEQTIRLPQSYWCYQPASTTPEVSALPAKSAGHVTFICLNDFTKVSEPAFDLWLEILRVTPSSRLVLHAPEGTARETLIERMRVKSISPERIEFIGFQPWEQYVECLAHADIALDPFPYGGGITTLDALWMGLPVVTLCGRTVVGRGGTSILSNLELPELIAHTSDRYFEIAARFADDLPRLDEFRMTLRERMERSPLRDTARLVRNLETAYREMWTRR
jgi:predicted O-linked N-acetylglucosamine transferase (SPINDLY family)